MMTKIRPLHDRVVVKRLEGENKTAGGIVIPDTAGEKPDQDALDAGPQVLQQYAVADQDDRLTEDGRGRWKEYRADQIDGGQMPQDEQTREAQRVAPVAIP